MDPEAGVSRSDGEVPTSEGEVSGLKVGILRSEGKQ